MYKVWIVYTEAGRKFFVVNSKSRQVQSSWSTYSGAVMTARLLNRTVGRAI